MILGAVKEISGYKELSEEQIRIVEALIMYVCITFLYFANNNSPISSTTCQPSIISLIPQIIPAIRKAEIIIATSTIKID